MTLLQAQAALNLMVAECDKHGIRPGTVELFTTDPHSGLQHEIWTMTLECTTAQNSFEEIGVPLGNYVVAIKPF